MLGIVELIVLVMVSAFISQNGGSILPVLVIGLAGIGVVLGCGNFSSIFIPQRMRQSQRGIQATGSSAGNAGCIRAVMSLGMMLVTVVLLVPVALALFLPVFFHIQWLWVLSIPLAILYAVAFYLLVTWLVAPQMLRRVPEILAITTRE